MQVAVAREVSAEAVTAHGITVTPRSRALVIRGPKGGLVWHRPTAVLVERDGRTRRVPIVDLTRMLQAGLLGAVLVTAGAGLLGRRSRMGGAA